MKVQAIVKKVPMLLKKTGGIIQKNSPTIFAGVAIAGVVGTTIMAVRATLRAKDIINEASYVDPNQEIDWSDASTQDELKLIKPNLKETIALTWKCYIPVVLGAGLTIGAIIAGHTINERRNAILAGLLTTSQQALEDYQKKAEEVIGHSKAEKIKEGIADDKMMNHPVDKSTITETGFGRSLCYDTWSGRYFWSDYEKVRQIVNDFNFQLNNDFSMALNEFYEMLHLDTAGCGEEVGFTTQRPLELLYKSRLASDGTPCLVIDYKYQPSPTFRDW